MNLKWLLVRRITLVALACLLAGSALAIRQVGAEAERQNAKLSEAVARHMGVQLEREHRGPARTGNSPDWGIVGGYELHEGQCLQLLDADGRVQRSRCTGLAAASHDAPGWFMTAFHRLLDGERAVSQDIAYRETVHGKAVAMFNPAATASHAWETIAPLLGFAAFLVALLCLTTYAIIDRALRPTQEIIDGLNRLARGDLSFRLPAFRLTELNRISEVFNALTGDLRRTTQESAELARRLVDAQEHERRRIARELHDEISQRLSALNALAACLRTTAQRDAPNLVEDARELEAIASSLMISLRRTLTGLRPQIIDDLGLVQGLQALVDQHNREARGVTRYSIEVAEGVDALRAETSAHVYRIVQEALTNAAKHAKARNVRVHLKQTGEPDRHEVKLTVTDDGDGLAAAAGPSSGSGIIGMRERVAALSGRFDAGPGAGGGFRLDVAFPAARPSV